MASEQFSMRLSKEIKNKLEELSKATGRSKAYLANEALDRYLDYETWYVQAVQEGIRAVDEGRVVSLEEVKLEWGLD